MLALYYCLGVVGVFAVFLGLGSAIAWTARRVKRPRRPELALAIGNLGAPRRPYRSVVLSLGAGLSLLVTVALVESLHHRQLTDRLRRRAPTTSSDVKRSEAEAFPRTSLRARRRRARCARRRCCAAGWSSSATVPRDRQGPPDAMGLSGDRGLSGTVAELDQPAAQHRRLAHLARRRLARNELRGRPRPRSV